MKLSIIVPVYNTQAYLARCLDSLIDERYTDYEIVVVNDGSTDSSEEIIESYVRRYPRWVRSITTPNGGLGHARNTGLAAAQGENILFVDSDDWLAPNAIREIHDTLCHRFDVAVFDFIHVNESGTELAAFSGCEYDKPFSLEEKPEFLFAPHNAVNKIWKRRLFSEHTISFPDRLWFEDLATIPKLYLHASVIYPVHRSWYCYFQRSGSIMLANSTKVERNMEMITVMETVLQYYRDQGAFGKYRAQLEYKFYYEEYLASVTRVNQIDAKSQIQAYLRDAFLRAFPKYRENLYVRKASPQMKLLDRMVRSGRWNAVRALIILNNKAKGR